MPALPTRQGRAMSAPADARFPVTRDLAQVPDLTRKHSSPNHLTSQCITGSGEPMTKGKTRPWDAEITSFLGKAKVGSGAIVITYSSSTSEAAQISDRGSSITAHLPTHIKDPSDPDPDYLAVWLYKKAGVAEAWWCDWLRGKKEACT